MKFDINAARSSGYSDDEIADYLAKENNFDLGAALKSGYSASEVVGFLAGAEAPAPAAPVTDTGDEAARLAAKYKAPKQPGIIERVGNFLKPEFKSVMEGYQPTPEQQQAEIDKRLSYGAGPIRPEVAAAAAEVNRGRAKTDSPTVAKVAKEMQRRNERPIDVFEVAQNPALAQAARDTKADEFRSAGEWAADTLSNLSQGAVGLVQLPINIIAPSSDIAATLRDTQKQLQAQESDVLKAQREQLRERVQNEDGFFDKYAATVVQLVTSPALGLSEAVKQVPNFLGIVGASRLVGAASAGAVGLVGRASPTVALGEAISGGAIQAGARAAGTTAGGIGASMAMTGGDAAGGVYEKLTDRKQTPLSVWEQNPDYQKLTADGKSSQDAIEEIATAKARMAALVTAPLGLLGFMGAEAAVASRGLGKATAEALTIAGAGKMLAKDLVGEQLEEGGTQFGGNVISRTVNPKQSLTEGVPEAMATALVTSAPFSTVGAASQYQEARAAQAPDLAAERNAVSLLDVNSYDPTLVDPMQTMRQRSDVGPAAPVSFTPVGAPTQQAGLVDIVVPTAPETTDVSTASLSPLATPRGGQQPGDQLGGSVGLPGSAVADVTGQRGGSAGQLGADVPQAGAVPGAAGEPVARLNRPFDRASDQDLLARTEASIASQENNNAVVQPTEQWFGRKGDGYATELDAGQALPGRKRMFPTLDWKVEEMPSGKFRLAGYEQQNTQPAPTVGTTEAGAGTPQPTQAAPITAAESIAAPSGKPFSTQQTAAVYAQQNGITGYSTVKMDGGWVIKPTETTLGTQTPQAIQGQAQQQQAPAVARAASPAVGQPLATGGAAQAQGRVDAGVGAVAAGPVAQPQPAGALATPEGAASAGLTAPLRLAPPAPLRAVGKAITAIKASTGVDAEIDNAPMTEQQQAASAIARLSGRTVTILKADAPGVLPNGFMLPGDNKNIYIANDSDDAPLSIAMHEIYHTLPEPQRKALNTQLLQLFRESRRGEFAAQFSYDANNDTLLDEEIPAFMVQAVSKREDFWQELRTKMGNKEFAEVAKVILSKLNSIISGAKTEYGDDFVNKYITDVAKARDLLTTAYAEAMQEQGLTPDVAAAPEAQAEVVASRREQRAPGNTEDNSLENNNADVMPPQMLGAGGIMFSLRKVEEVNDAPEITMQDLVGETVFPILADLTAAGYTYMGKELRGGPYYTLLPSNSKAGLIWANDGKGVASIKNKKAARGVIGLIVAMKQDSHATNNTVANIIFRAVEDEIQKGSVANDDIPKLDGIVRGLSERKAKNKKTGEMEAIFPKFADFPGFSDRTASENFLRAMPFEARGLFFEEMTKPTVEDLGLGVVRKVINDTVEPDLRGLNMGDVVMAIRFDPNADTIELGEASGTPEHDSYRYGVKGEVIGKFKRPISFENVFVDLMAERRAAGKDRPAGNYRSLTLRKPEQLITKEIADLVSSDSYKTFKSPAEAKSAVTSAGGGWSVIDRPTGAGVKEFLRTARIYGEGKVPSFAEAKVLIKDEDLKIFRLGETENWFSVESRGNKRVMTHIMVAQPGVRRETLFGDMVYQAKANGATHIEIDGVEAAIQEQERERPVAPIIAELSAMKDADLVNLGISPKEINRLNGLIEEEGAEQFSPTSLLMYSKRVQSPADRIKWRKIGDVKTEIGLDALPRHIIPFATFMRTMADKAANGGLTSRDLIKAYTIARSSMNRSAVTTSKIKDAGLVLPENFVDEKIRPEGAFGYWLLSPVGQRYLNAAEVAIVDEQAVADAVKVMAPFGTQNALGKDLERAAAGELHTRLPGMTAAIAKAATGKNAVKDWQDATNNLFGVREAKKGFLGSLLGFGQLPTFDARQININVKADSKEDTLRALSSVKARDVVAKLSRRMDALSLTMDPEYAPFYQHLAHHAVWDAVGGTETTHSDVVESMLMASNRAAPTFYSQLERVITSVPAKLATQPASQWALWLDSNGPKQGVKKDEVEWSGIKDYLALRGKDKVTSADLQAYLKDGGVKVEERTLTAEEPGMDLDDWMAEWAEENPGRTADAILDGEPWDEILKVAEKSGDTEIVDRISNKNSPAKYGKYTLPGGESYREILLKLPVFGKEKKLQAEEAAMARAIERNDIGMQRAYGPALEALRAEKARFVRTYQSSHWDDKNVLAHIRVNDRTDADGKRVLFVEEVQSDWGQDGLKKGFKGKTQEDAKRFFGITDADWAKASEEDREAYRDEMLQSKGRDVIPAAPFVTKTEGWLNLALKRIAMLAVDEGYDKVAFVNGQQSADRYDLSKQISSISYEPGSKPENEGLLQAWDLDRKMVMSEMVTPDRVEDYIGKEVAVRLLETDKVRGKHLLDGENVKVGGKGMIKFYDEIVPQALGKLLPKIGGEKLGTVAMGEAAKYRAIQADADGGGEVVTADGETVSFHDTAEQARAEARRLNGGVLGSTALEQPGFDVTDKMRETVGAGLPMFSKRVAVPDTAEFKKWFGDSKVVDESGEPLVVYHGTSADITAFDPKEVGTRHVDVMRDLSGADLDPTAFYFTDDVGTASWYANSASKQTKGGGNVLPVYLSMQNPLEVDFQGEGIEYLAEELEKAKEGGYDGLIARNYDDGRVANHYIVFKPTQIKSATGNSGEFDATNPDIRRSNRSSAVKSELETLFQDLQDSRGLKLVRANERVAEHPMASQIEYVNANFYDILEQLDDAGAIKINCK